VREKLAQPWRTDPTGVRLLVRVTPKSAREGIDAVTETAQGPSLTVRVRAVAEKGEANRAVEKAVAAWLGVPKSSVAVTAGGKSRLKTVVVAGEPAGLAALVEARMAALP
jgi:uncharacterized protein YggU (UPF0235/DUF167 family)